MKYFAVLWVCILGGLLLEGEPLNSEMFVRGEYMRYKVHYGFMNAGYVHLEVGKDLVKRYGRDCFYVRGRGESNGVFGRFFRVEDTYESFVDAETLLPVQFNRDIREGNFEHYSETWFNREQGRAWFLDEKGLTTRYLVPDGIHDVLSAHYHLRGVDFDMLGEGEEIPLQYFMDRKVIDLKVQYGGKEVIRVGRTYYDGIRLELALDKAKVVKGEGKVTAWFSDDGNRIPLRIRSELKVGSIKADLVEAQGLRYPFSAKKEAN